jgi:hypothetical protein
MTELRYRIQVGNKYTYRNSSYEMESLVRKLIDGDSVESLQAQIRGIKAEKTLVKPEAISITVEISPKPKEEEWHDVSAGRPRKQPKKEPKPRLTPEARKEWRKQFRGRK